MPLTMTTIPTTSRAYRVQAPSAARTMVPRMALAVALLAGAVAACTPPSADAPSATAATTKAPRAAGAVPDDAVPSPPPYGAFAYADAVGTRLLVFDSIADATALTTAICAPGTRLSVTAERGGWLSPADSAAAQSGDPAPRYRFRLTAGALLPDETCFVTGDAALAASAVRVRPLSWDDCHPEWSQRVAAVRGRAVRHCWPMARVEPGTLLYAVQFVEVNRMWLASLVADDGDRLWFHDLETEARDAGEDAWRVGDGGQFSPEFIRPLVASRPPAGLVLGFSWLGQEGESAFVLAADGEGRLREVAEGYRYGYW